METIYLEETEEITSALDKIRQAQGQNLVVAIPKGSLLLQSVVNLELLRRQVEILNKHIAIVTDDDMGARLAKRVGLDVQKKRLEPQPVSSEADKELEIKLEPKEPKAMPEPISSEIPADNTQRVALADIVSTPKTQARISNASKPRSVRRILTNKKSDKKKPLYFGGYAVDPKRIKPQKIEEEMHLTKKYPRKKESRITNRMAQAMLGFALIGALVVVLVAWLVLPKATLKITLKTESVRQNFEMIATTSPDNNETVLDAVPADLKQVEKSETKIFKTTGKKNLDSQAKGEVIIFNAREVKQRLVATTRLQTPDGKIFRLDKEVTIPSGTVDSPGQITAKVTADMAGPAGNIEPTNFKIASFVEQGSELANLVYAKSTTGFTGGLGKNTPFVSQADYDTAQDEIKQDLQKIAWEEIKAGLSEGLTILPEGLQVELIEVKSDKLIGAEAENFEMTVRAKISALVFKEKDVLSASLDAINLTIGDNKKVKEESLEGINYKIKSVDLAAGITIFEVVIDKEVVEDIDLEKVKQQLAGKKEAEVAEYISGLDGVDGGELSLWPFWVKSVPKNVSKIDIILE